MATMTIAEKKRPPHDGGPGRPTFENAARTVMREVQDAFARLIASVPAAQISKAADFQKALGVDPKLGWRVFRIAKAENVLAMGAEVPSAVSMRKLFKAAAKQRVPAKVIERASGAFDRFEELVAEHAGDRDSFTSMVSSLGPTGSPDLDQAHRRAAFRGNSHIWGLQAKLRMSCGIIQPSSDDPNSVDAVFLRGVVGLRQLRRDRPFRISAIATLDSDGATRNPDMQRLEVVDDEHGVNLLRDYCTHPLPTIQNFRNERGLLVTHLTTSDVGSSAAFSGFLCDVHRKGDVRYRDERNPHIGIMSSIEHPYETAQIDAFIRRGTYSDRPLTFASRTVNRVGTTGYSSQDILSVGEPARYLGLGAESLHTSEYPRYVEMINYVMERLGWDPSEFEAYRYRLEYPVMNTAVVVECPLPEKPSSPPKPKPA